MATTEEARAARDAKLDALHEQLTDAVESPVSGECGKRALAFAARFRARSFNNTLLIFVQHQAAFEAGPVPEPVPSYVAESWRRLGRFENPKPGGAVRSRMVGVRPAYVWDLSQTAGDPIPTPPSPRLLEGEAPDGLWEGITAQVEAQGFTVMRVPHEGMIHGANGLTDFGAKTVAARDNILDAAEVKTLVHELAHVLLHGPDNPDATEHRGIGEVEVAQATGERVRKSAERVEAEPGEPFDTLLDPAVHASPLASEASVLAGEDVTSHV